MSGTLVVNPSEHPADAIRSERVAQRLREAGNNRVEHIRARDYATLFSQGPVDTLVYFPLLTRDMAAIPDSDDAERFLQRATPERVGHLIVISSAMIYGARPHNPGLIPETQALAYGSGNRIAACWIDLETRIEKAWSDRSQGTLTVLRPAATPVSGGRDYFSRLLSGAFAFTLAGHDPSLQWLHPDDLASATLQAMHNPRSGVYNVAPKEVMTLRTSFRLTGTRRAPTPRWPQRLIRKILTKRLLSPVDQIEYVRYSWTVSGEQIRQDLGFVPAYSSVETLLHFLQGDAPGLSASADRLHKRLRKLPAHFDDFGLDLKYMDAYSGALFKFLHDFYWRVEYQGIEHVPTEGRVLLAGVHRGFMPLDGVMANYLIYRETGRCPRFLIHPTLIKFPFQFNFMTKIGGIIACQQNADHVLSRDGMVGFYPEGIQGAFRYYRGVYTLGKFGHNEFIRMALRNRAPIVPFVNVGSAEIFPVVAKIKWKRWMRFTLWPAFPIAPPFPFLPVPLPSRWHVRFLEPLHIEQQYPPEAEHDPDVVMKISGEIRNRMQSAINNMLARRKHIFWGSIFEE